MLTADIALNDTTNWQSWDMDTEGLKHWTPIGYGYDNKYTGIFDGQGYTISGLYISDKDSDLYSVGLFGTLWGDVCIKNINVSEAYIYHKNNYRPDVGVGLVIGEYEELGGTFENISAYGNILVDGAEPWVGGVAGVNWGNDLTGCCFNGSVTVINNHYAACCAGGIVGYGNAKDCYNLGSVSVSTSYGRIYDETDGLCRRHLGKSTQDRKLLQYGHGILLVRGGLRGSR